MPVSAFSKLASAPGKFEFSEPISLQKSEWLNIPATIDPTPPLTAGPIGRHSGCGGNDMPLEILLALVAGGISVTAFILHMTGRSALTVMSVDEARSAWLRQFPEDDVSQILTAQDGHAALLQTSQGMGLVWAFGADTVARPLQGCDLSDRPDGLRVSFHEFAAPSTRLTLSETERADWRLLMNTA